MIGAKKKSLSEPTICEGETLISDCNSVTVCVDEGQKLVGALNTSQTTSPPQACLSVLDCSQLVSLIFHSEEKSL